MNWITRTLFGGQFMYVRTSSTCDWYEWKRTSESRWARRIDSLINPS
jgi:hypothetical protein